MGGQGANMGCYSQPSSPKVSCGHSSSLYTNNRSNPRCSLSRFNNSSSKLCSNKLSSSSPCSSSSSSSSFKPYNSSSYKPNNSLWSNSHKTLSPMATTLSLD